MVVEKIYEEFIFIVNSKNLKITCLEDETHYHLIAKHGVVFYQTYVNKNNSAQRIDYETNYLASSDRSFADVTIPTVNNTGLLTKPYTALSIMTKNELGDPLTIKSTANGIDVQLLTITYDADGDLQSVTVSDL